MENILPKWITCTIGILLIILIAFLVLNQANTFMGSPQTMRVSGIGKVTATPDLATITLGVTTQGSNPIDIKDKNNQKINQIIAFIKQQHIDNQDIQTSRLDISPRYDYTNGQNNITGYQADQTVTVRVHDVDKSQTQLENIIDGAVNNGANQVQGVNFGFTDTEKFQLAARKLAIEKAKEKAQQLATDANLKLGRVVHVIESPSNNYTLPLAMSFGAQNKSVKPNIQPGNQDIVENIELVFAVW